MTQESSVRAIREKENVPPSILVDGCAKLFDLKEFTTLYYLLLRLLQLFRPIKDSETKRDYSWLFHDWYMLINLGLALGAVLFQITFSTFQWWFQLIIKIWIAWQIYEIVILQINVIFFDRYRRIRKALDEAKDKKEALEIYKVRGYTRRLLEAVLRYIEVISWFAVLYFNYHNEFEPQNGIWLDKMPGAILASIQVISGFGNIIPKTTFGAFLTISHSAIGIFMTILLLSFSISLLGYLKIRTMEPTEQDN